MRAITDGWPLKRLLEVVTDDPILIERAVRVQDSAFRRVICSNDPKVFALFFAVKISEKAMLSAIFSESQHVDT